MNRARLLRIVPLAGILGACWLAATAVQARDEARSRLDQVLDRIVENEAATAERLDGYRPLFETYLQTVKPDSTLGTVPVGDHYFFGRLDPASLAGDAGEPRDGKNGKKARKKRQKGNGLFGKNKDGPLDLFDAFHSQTLKPAHFVRMLTIDRGAFDRSRYDFEFLRAEFLGEVRTLVFDVVPKRGEAIPKVRAGRFTGRIWVDDRDHAIVRFNGIYASTLPINFHFDSWRLEMEPGVWLPAYVYTEETEPAFKHVTLTHKGQTRIWGYNVERPSAEDEFTQVLIDAPETRDQSDRPGSISPIESARAWESEAEDNVLRRLERAGLLAPPGEVDEILETVVANLEITNGLDIRPPVRCRVLLTTPLESFTVGHTIVISRGLLDVLPDEASLAAFLAHELGHVLEGHELDTRYAFSDQVLIADGETLHRFDFDRDPLEEQSADARAVELLRNSPYASDLDKAGLFLKALSAHSEQLPSLIRPHFGSRMAEGARTVRLAAVVDEAPALEPGSVEQIAALPLGGRVHLDPWSARVALMGGTRVPLLSAREKLAFQVTPLMPHLARHGAGEDGIESGVAAVDRTPAGTDVADRNATERSPK